MSDFVRSSTLASLCVLFLVTAFLQGCVSSSTFDDFKHETRREITSLHSEQSRLESEISSLHADIKRLRNLQQDLSIDVRERLRNAETKLKEMEDRVIEIRLQIQRVGGINRK